MENDKVVITLTGAEARKVWKAHNTFGLHISESYGEGLAYVGVEEIEWFPDPNFVAFGNVSKASGKWEVVSNG